MDNIADNNVVIGGIYKHFKGNNYKVINIARHSETLEQYVVYVALYDSPEYGMNAVWIRPLHMFLEEIERDGKRIKRFTYVQE